MKCSKCEHYSYQLSRCRLGKINPRTIKGGIDAVKWMGISYICLLSPLRAKIIAGLTKQKKPSV
jgi:hypothetical protein